MRGVQLLAAQKAINRPGWWKGKFVLFQVAATVGGDPDNHVGVITHLEPDILACEVKWALFRL